MARRGRPRAARPMLDYGTPENIKRRLELVQGGAPELSEYPLGVLLARGLIDQDQHQGGEKYAALYAKALGLMKQLGFDPGKGTLQDSDLERIEGQYLECRHKLARCGLKVHQLVDNITVHREMPLWIGKPGTYGFDDLTRLRYGLDALADILVRKRGR